MTWLPLTAAQRGIYLAHALEPDNPCYTTAEAVRVAGTLDEARLTTALATAYAEFEQVRVRFRLTPDGPQQQVLPGAGPGLVLVRVADEAEARAWCERDLARPMDLAAGDCVRAALLRLADGTSWWYHAAHHAVLDGFGAVQLLRRVAAAYADPTPATGIPLADLVAADPGEDAAGLEFWTARIERMESVPALSGRTAGPASRAIRAHRVLDDATQRALVAGARRLGVTWADVFTAAVGGYLGRMVGAADVRVGVTLMNRSVPGRGTLPSGRTVCTAMNVLPLTVPAAGPLGDALARVRGGQEQLRPHPFVRQETLSRLLGRRLPGAQLFGPQVNLVPFDLELDFGGLPGGVINLTAGPVEDMTWCLRGIPGRGHEVRLELDANPRLYEPAEMELHLARFEAWLDTMAGAAADADLAGLPLLTDAERRLVVEDFNATGRPVEPRTLPEAFAAQVAATPEQTALIFGDRTSSYAELAARATVIAEQLERRGVRPGDVVGLALPRCLGLYEALYAVQRLGAVYLPLEPGLPAERIAAMVEDSGCVLVVHDGEPPTAGVPALSLSEVGPGSPASEPAQDPGVRRDDEGPRPPAEGPRPPAAVPRHPGLDPGSPTLTLGAPSPVGPDDPAYLLFTSGSTGRPKGVLVGHRAIDNRLAWMQHHLRLAPGERVLHKTPISFDVSVWELFWPLQVGATVVIAEPDAHRDPRRIADLVVEHEVTTLHFVPSMLRALLADPVACARLGEGRVRNLVCSGEALTGADVRRCVEVLGVPPVNLYGPTEAAVDVTCWDTDPAEDEVPIGVPIWNTRTYVLDAGRRPVPVGVAGELYLAGVQLAHGYVGRPELTAERFVADPFVPGERMYRTGDLAAWRADGALRYLGRVDDQVKVRGQRIELGEIEAAAAGVPGVDAWCAGVVPDAAGSSVLVLWFVSSAEGAEAALRQRLESRLPASFVPSHLIAVEELPVTASGKADRRTLAARGLPQLSPVGAGARTLTEQRVGELMAEVTGQGAPVPADADFFTDLGGDSLSALRLMGAAETAFGVPLRIADVFAHSTPSALAAVLRGEAPGEEFEAVLPLRRGAAGATPLFLLPPAGGLGWCYTTLLASLPAGTPVYTLQTPGLEAGRPEPAADLTALAERQLLAIRQVIGGAPFHVAGWSLGGMAAHAVACAAARLGQRARAVLIDAYPSDQWRHLAEPTESEALLGILRLGGLDAPEGAELTRPVVREELRRQGSALGALPTPVLDGCIASVVEATRIVRGSRHDVLDGDLTVLVATAPRPETWLSAGGWAPYVSGRVSTVPIDATHGALLRRPVADRVGAALVDALGLD